MRLTSNAVETMEPHRDMRGKKTHHLKLKKTGGYPLRCLVVDDDKIILKIVVHMLTKIGFQKVDIAQNKPELMNKLTTGSYDILVTDLMMPDMNGYDLTLRMKMEMPDIKVIIMTGIHKNECTEMIATGWVDGWLFKPFKGEELQHMIEWVGVL